jgi:hypothetical protein
MKVKNVPFADALATLKSADVALQNSKAGPDRRATAIAFANAERVAKSAKKRESEVAVSSLLDSVPAAKGGK